MRTHLSSLLRLAAGLLVATAASAQDSGLGLDRFALDGGGGTSSGSGFTIDGSLQALEAGPLEGGGFSLTGGFQILAAVRAADAAPETIFDNLAGSVNGGSGVTSTTWLASRFCLGAKLYALDSVSLLLNSQDFSGAAGPPCNVRLQIFTHDRVTGKPAADTGLIMNLDGLTNPITLDHGQQLVRWTNATPFTLSAGTCYWAVLSGETGKRLGMIGSFTWPTGEAGSFGASSSVDAGLTWGAVGTAQNQKMLIRATPALGLLVNGVERAGNDLHLAFTSRAGTTYGIEVQPGLSSAAWIPLEGTTTPGTGGTVRLTIPNAFTQPQQFYRVRQLP